ncbi:hypothetical protein [Myroides odoratus]|uniref:hypothetical protein n=1 Tax=Myroides odoratus TaxID=256 RepID=UPI0039AF00B9
MKKLFFLITCLLPLLGSAQDYEYKNFKFDDTPFELPKELASESEFIILQSTQLEYINQDNSSKQIMSYYIKTYINSQEAIERNNKKYIPIQQGDQLIEIKLRVIHKNGKITFLDEKSIEKEINTQTGIENNYFPIEGLEVGTILDIHYVLITPAEIKGKIIYLQNVYYVQKRTIELIYPDYLKFVSRSYNGAVDLLEDKGKYKDKISFYGENSNIPAIADNEQYSNWFKNAMHVHTRFYSNSYSETVDPFGEKEFTAEIHANLHRTLDKNEQKQFQDFSKKIQRNKDELTQIRAIESYIKTTIQHNSYLENTSLTEIFKSKQATLNELTFLYIKLFETFDIPYELVFTSNPHLAPFDPNFVSYVSLSNFLFYFPNIKAYLDPATLYTRTPIIDLAYHEQYGLFIQNKIYAGIKMGVSDFKKIELPYFYSKDSATIHVDLSNLENPLVSSHLEFTGEMASSYQSYLYFSSPIERESIEKDLFESYTIETDFISATTTHADVELIGLKPFILDISYKATDLLKKAGTTFIFEIGAVIGKQMEFYSDKPRQLPIQLSSARSYKRSITLKLPKGYRIKNVEDLNMKVYLDQQNKKLAYFTTTYKQEEDILQIENLEGYNFKELPVSYWDQYRKVINAAADFNKLSLILEKNK